MIRGAKRICKIWHWLPCGMPRKQAGKATDVESAIASLSSNLEWNPYFVSRLVIYSPQFESCKIEKDEATLS